MTQNDRLPKAEGRLEWVLYDEKTGQVKKTGFTCNQVQHQCNDLVMSRATKAGGSSASMFTHMKLSIDTIPADTTTTLTSYVSGPFTVVAPDASASNNVITVLATIPAGRDTGSIQSAGLFSTPTNAGLRLCASCVMTKAAGDALALTWTLTLPYS